MLNHFYNTPVLNTELDDHVEDYLYVCDKAEHNYATIQQQLENNKIIVVRNCCMADAAELFEHLVECYDLEESYNLQMQYVVHMMEDREAVDDVAVTVNERGPNQMIQAHSEGDSTSPLDLLALFCEKNSESGGHNVLSLINQGAVHERLVVREKVLVGEDIEQQEKNHLTGHHRDTYRTADSIPEGARILAESENGAIAVSGFHLESQISAVNGEDVVTYWDNVTVHDLAFHQHQFELLRHCNILHQAEGDDFRNYMHVEEDSDWAPANTCSGSLEDTAQLFSCHIIHKMQAGDFLIVNNRIWTHAVNNWPAEQPRKLFAMYA